MWGIAAVAFLSKTFARSFRRRLFGSLRVSLYLGCVGAVALIANATRAKAQVVEHSFELAKELMPVADLLEGATALRVNGETINFSMTVLPTSVKEVLDRMQRHCEHNPGPFPRKLRELSQHVPNVPFSEPVKRLLETAALARDESDTRGAILCFAGSGGVRSANEELPEGDLAALGSLRYVIAERGDAKGGEDKLTRVISLWTEGSFHLDRLHPPAFGDASGSDSSVLPRPPGSTRIFTAEAVGATYAVRLYETDSTPTAVLEFYDRTMAEWSPSTITGRENEGRGFIRGAQPLIVHVSRDDTKTIVTLTEMGSTTQPLQALHGVKK